mmetsp:Transcript_28243/g.59089  ORF Transcript_28243/g.59089 Transcript_28243/m.59089 type:complete len:90 (+) Transcript_28243:1016-1285(+)
MPQHYSINQLPPSRILRSIDVEFFKIIQPGTMPEDDEYWFHEMLCTMRQVKQYCIAIIITREKKTRCIAWWSHTSHLLISFKYPSSTLD